MTRNAPSPALLVAWLALLVLLTMTVTFAYIPLGRAQLAVALVIAALKALLVASVFMELRKRGGLTIAFAAAGFFWLGILLWLAFTDFLTRQS
jgi:cytochrome c oxidase subunit 4